LAVVRGDVVLEERYAPRRREAGDVVRLLDGHRHAVQRADGLSSGETGVCRAGGGARAIEVAHHDGVDLTPEAFDALDVALGQLERADLTGADQARELAGGLDRKSTRLNSSHT